MCGFSSAIRAAITSPVRAPMLRPRCWCPNANHTLAMRGRRTDDGEVIRERGTKAHPAAHLAVALGRQVGEHLAALAVEAARALVVRRGVEGGELDVSADAQAVDHLGEAQSSFTVRDRATDAAVEASDDVVVAALALQRNRGTQLARQRLRPGAGRDHEALHRDRGIRGANGAHAVRADLEAPDLGLHEGASRGAHLAGDRPGEAEGVEGVAAVGEPGRVAVVRMQGRLELTDLVRTELVHPRAERAEPRTLGRSLLEAARGAVHGEGARVADVLLGGRSDGEPPVGLQGVPEQGGERAGIAHAGRGGRIGREAREPGGKAGQVAPSDRERRAGVEQVARQRRKHGHGRQGQGVVEAAEHAQVAEGSAHSGRPSIHDAHLESRALQESGAAHADDARPDDRDPTPAAHRRRALRPRPERS